MNEAKNGVEFSGKFLGIISALIALISVLGTFYNNLKNYVEASGYFGYFSIDIRYVNIGFYSNSYNFVTQILIVFLQFVAAFCVFNFIRRISTNKRIEKMVRETEVRKYQQKKLNKIFYINRDIILSIFDVVLFFVFLFAAYMFELLLSGNTTLFLSENFTKIFSWRKLLEKIWLEIPWVLVLYLVHSISIEMHFVWPIEMKEDTETLTKILKSNQESPDGKKIQDKIKDIDDYVTYERKLASIRLFAAALLFSVGLTIGVGLPASYFTGIGKARTQKEFWIAEEGVAFQIDDQSYMMLGCDVSEDEEGNSIISINPNQMELLSTTGILVEKQEFDIVNVIGNSTTSNET